MNVSSTLSHQKPRHPKPKLHAQRNQRNERESPQENAASFPGSGEYLFVFTHIRLSNFPVTTVLHQKAGIGCPDYAETGYGLIFVMLFLYVRIKRHLALT